MIEALEPLISTPATAARKSSSLAAALWAPWRSNKPQALWMSAAMFALFSLTAVFVAVVLPGGHRETMALGMYAAGAAILWAFGMSGLLSLARDACELALAGVVRNSVLSLWLYALATIALPTLAAAFMGWSMALAALLAALAVAGGLAFVLLPRWLAMWIGFVPLAYTQAQAHLHGFSMLSPGFLRWGSVALLVLAGLVIVRARQFARGDIAGRIGWGGPMLAQMRRQAVTCGWAPDKQWAWQASSSQHRHFELRGISADTPVKVIEVAMGGVFMPRTPVGNLRRALTMLWPVALFAGAMLVQSASHVHSLHRLLLIGGLSGVLWLGMFGMAMLAIMLPVMLRRRWTQGSEPALLALLPGLARRAPPARSLLRAAFTKPALLCVALWALMLAGELAFNAAIVGQVIAITTLLVLGMAAVTAMLTLRAFAGLPAGKFGLGVLTVLATILMMASLPLAMTLPKLLAHTPQAIWAAWALDVAWLLLAGWAAFRARHAWRVLQQRPHPFLAVES